MQLTGAFVLLLAVCQLGHGRRISRYNPYRALREMGALDDHAELLRSLGNFQLRETRMCSNPADIIFILDESRSIWGPDFDREKEFVKKVVKLFDPTVSRFGVETFSVGADIKFHLGDFTKQEDVLDAIDKIQQAQGGSTETWAALERLYKEMFTPARIRPGVEQIAILITDGASQEAQRTINEAANAHNHGITIFAIGVKRAVREAELRAIASDPDSEYMYMLEDWTDSLDKIMESLAYKACPPNIDDCTNSGELDIVFSVSGRATPGETQASFGLIKSVLGKMKLGPTHMQAGLARRDCLKSWDAIALNTHDSHESFAADLDTRVTSSELDLHLRLESLTEDAFQAENGARDTASNVGVLFVDSPSGLDDAKELADKAKETMALLIVAVGKDLPAASLRGLASEGNSLIQVDSYSDLQGQTQAVVNRLCEALLDRR